MSRMHDAGIGLNIADGHDLCRIRDGIYANDLALAAVGWLDVFGWLVQHRVDLDGLCRGLGLAPRPADVMCTLFRAMGLLEAGQEQLLPYPSRPSRCRIAIGLDALFAAPCANAPAAANS